MNVVKGASGDVWGVLSAFGEAFLSIATPAAVRSVVHIMSDVGQHCIRTKRAGGAGFRFGHALSVLVVEFSGAASLCVAGKGCVPSTLPCINSSLLIRSKFFIFFLTDTNPLCASVAKFPCRCGIARGNFSVGRLMEFLASLRQDVEITVRPTRKEHGALSVVSA